MDDRDTRYLTYYDKRVESLSREELIEAVHHLARELERTKNINRETLSLMSDIDVARER